MELKQITNYYTFCIGMGSIVLQPLTIKTIVNQSYPSQFDAILVE
jgi:hypothetical protein